MSRRGQHGMVAEGWRSIPDVPAEIATQFEPNENAWMTQLVFGRSIVYDIGGEWYRIYVSRDNDVYYQQWSDFA